jgi:hypothetical protein
MINNNRIASLQVKKWLVWLIPMGLAIGIKVFTHFPKSIEIYYSIKVYPYIACLQRVLFGWLPFSFGDVCYFFFIIYLIIYLIKLIIVIIKKQFSLLMLKRHTLRLLLTILWVYIIFNVLWGLNYDRLGIASQLQLKNTTYTTDELKDLLCDVIDELNDTRLSLGDSNYVYPTEKEIIDKSYNAYANVNNRLPFLKYVHPSVKPSLLTTMVSYAGYSGYYNPFSGEAQVNTDLPKFYMPFVTCHEMAHQLGYASESEASFVGYLAAIHSKDTLFRYSALFELFLTANAELLQRDFWSGILNLRSLNPLVKRDRRIFREFILGRQNNVEPIVKNVYDQYLKANQQKSGINSYNELVAWVIDYRKTHLSRQSSIIAPIP